MYVIVFLGRKGKVFGFIFLGPVFHFLCPVFMYAEHLFYWDV